MVNRSHFGRCTVFKQDIVEWICVNSYNPTSINCFIKCTNFLSGKDYREETLTFLWEEKRQSNVMTPARIQPFWKNTLLISYWLL